MEKKSDRTDFQSGHFVKQFVFGDAEIHAKGDSLHTSIIMGPHLAGWGGIPHGGIAMGAVAELASLSAGWTRDDRTYPFTAEFRLGGTSARIGDTVHFELVPEGKGWKGQIRVNHDSAPYLKAEISRTTADISSAASSLPFITVPSDETLIPLPYARECFVCGSERRYPGLKRKFFYYDSETHGRTVLSRVGFDPVDRESFYAFQENGILRPLPIMALLDETIGWGGFMMSSAGAVTVRIAYTLLRQVAVGEKMIFYGYGEKIKGRAESRLLFWASGGAAVIGENGALEPVALASGQWMAMKELTEQMKTHLMPKEMVQKAFDLAGNPLTV